MTRILAVDTAADIVSAACLIADDDTVVETLAVNREKNQHTEHVIALIDEALGKAQLALADIDVVAFGAGPGAFTGLRVACGVAQGLAWAADKSVACVGNLAAAADLLRRRGARGTVVVAHDARMNECYCAAFDLHDGAVQEREGAQLVRPQDLPAFIEGVSAQRVAGNGFAVYAQQIALPDTLELLPDYELTALDIAHAARTLVARGELTSAALAAPLYVRNRVALTIEDRARGERL